MKFLLCVVHALCFEFSPTSVNRNLYPLVSASAFPVYSSIRGPCFISSVIDAKGDIRMHCWLTPATYFMQKLSKHCNFRFARTYFSITLDWSMIYCSLPFTFSENSKIWALPSNNTSDTIEMELTKIKIAHFSLYIVWIAKTQLSPISKYVYMA